MATFKPQNSRGQKFTYTLLDTKLFPSREKFGTIAVKFFIEPYHQNIKEF